MVGRLLFGKRVNFNLHLNRSQYGPVRAGAIAHFCGAVSHAHSLDTALYSMYTNCEPSRAAVGRHAAFSHRRISTFVLRLTPRSELGLPPL